MSAGDRARVTTFVAVDVEDAFDAFTEETNLWWRHGKAYRGGGPDSVVRFEGPPDRRLVEVYTDGTSFEVGRVLVWERGARLVFEWRPRQARGPELTEVEVLFQPAEGGTRVVLEHRGWDAIPPKHPVRHGMDGAPFAAMIGSWWGDLMTSFRLHAAAPPSQH